MAKHAKKDNIINYDEAKLKKLQEREEEISQSGKHFRSDYEDSYSYSEFDDIQNEDYSGSDDGFIEDADRRKTDRSGYGRQRSTKNGGKYSYDNQRIPQNLVNFIIVGVMAAFLIFFSVMLYNFYVVETINVIGNESIKYHDIAELCGVEYKQSMLKVKEEDIIESFESKLPMIEVIEVNKHWPNILEIQIKEREPVCYLVLKGSQKCALIGEDNICLAIEDSYLKGDLPRIYGLDVGTGELGKEITDGEARKLEVLKLLIGTMIETECISELESININNTTNIVMESTTGTTIKIGDTTNLTTKFKNVKIGIRRLISEGNTDVIMVVTGDNAIYIE